MQSRIASDNDRIEVLMHNRVSPLNQLFEGFAPAFVPRVEGVDIGPNIDAESLEIRTNGAGMRIAAAKASIPVEFPMQDLSNTRWRNGDDVID